MYMYMYIYIYICTYIYTYVYVYIPGEPGAVAARPSTMVVLSRSGEAESEGAGLTPHTASRVLEGKGSVAHAHPLAGTRMCV